MKTFSQKTRIKMYHAYNRFCSIEGCTERPDDFHHIMPNTETNQKKYPNYIQSVFNCVPICREHHVNNKPKISEKVVEVYESELERIKK